MSTDGVACTERKINNDVLYDMHYVQHTLIKTLLQKGKWVASVALIEKKDSVLDSPKLTAQDRERILVEASLLARPHISSQ